MTATFEPEIITIDPQVWKHLTDSKNPPEIFPNRDRNISPSGKWVVYSRESPSYTPPPCPQGPCLSPMELWLARVDGSESTKVGDLGRGTYCSGAGWFEAEHKVLLICGYEGPAQFMIADLGAHEVIDFKDIAGEPVIALEREVFSPDSTKFAINRMVTRTVELQAIPLDGSSVTNFGEGIKVFQWSSEGQRLYYLQRITPSQCTPAAIHAYDFSTRQDKIVLGPEVVLSPTRRVTLDACEHAFLVSPTENAVLLILGKAGSWIVGLP